MIKKMHLTDFVAAISVGIVNNELLLDLCYGEDSNAQVDLNLVMTEKGEIIEIQGTGEENPFTKGDMIELVEIAEKGIKELVEYQKEALGSKADLIEEAK